MHQPKRFPSTDSLRSTTPDSRSFTPDSRSLTPDGFPRSFPTRTEWDTRKEIIRELYIERNMTLGRLREFMEQHHNFRAEDHEYKRRLAQWNFRKNYKSAEKEAVAKHLDTFRALGQSFTNSEFLLNDKPLRMDKIDRHRKAARRRSNKTVALHLNPEASTDMDYPDTLRGMPNFNVQQHLRSALATPPVPRYSFPKEHSEAILWNVQQFDQNRREMIRNSPAAAAETDQVFDIMFNIVRAVHIFGAGDFESATRNLNQCFSSVKDLLQHETWNFMMYMTVLQTLPAWEHSRCRDLYRVVYTFFAGMSDHVLGQHHPVTNFMRLATNFEARREVLEAACALVLELGCQQYDMIQSMTNYTGGIMFNAETGLDLKLLHPTDFDIVNDNVNNETQHKLRQSLGKLVKILREQWDYKDLDAAAELIAKRKQVIEEYVRNLVGALNLTVGADESVWDGFSTVKSCGQKFTQMDLLTRTTKNLQAAAMVPDDMPPINLTRVPL